MIILIAAALSFTAAIVSNRVMVDMISRDFETRANDLARTVAVSVDASLADKLRQSVARIYDSAENRVGNDRWGTPEFEEYTSLFTSVSESGGYARMLESLRKIQAVNDVDCIYFAYVDVDTESMVYVVDAALEDACPTGSTDPIFDVNRPVLYDPTIGFPAYITDTEEYGWLVAAGAPVITQNNKVAGYAMVDISMADVQAQQREFILTLTGLLTAITAAVALIAILFVNRAIVRPIKQISRAASEYKTNDPEASRGLFAALNIKKHDEVGTLAAAIKKMESDINDNIASLINVNRQLIESRRVAREMNELANKDALTGVRNKLAYDEEAERLNGQIAAGDARFGIAMVDLNFLKKINDTWGHDRGNEALVKVCKMICDTFVHSPVFRIGGDEFVVVLENADYDHEKELVASFRKAVKQSSEDTSLEPWDRISAAIGTSLFDPAKDASVDDVFRRADVKMYNEKKKMKSIRE